MRPLRVGRGEQTRGAFPRRKRAPIIHTLAYSVNSAGARTSCSHVGGTNSRATSPFLETTHRLKYGKRFGSAPPHTAHGMSVAAESDDDDWIRLRPHRRIAYTMEDRHEHFRSAEPPSAVVVPAADRHLLADGVQHDSRNRALCGDFRERIGRGDAQRSRRGRARNHVAV
jgi:hypothetical protein